MDMQMCMKDYPDLYGNKDPMDVEEDEEEILNEKTEGKTIDKAEENRWLLFQKMRLQVSNIIIF